MCGIAGIIGARDEARARALIAPLAHRGPDGVRVEVVGDATLAHARLSIIDLEHGWQPLHAAGSTVVGNGEIYNYLELIEEFGLKDKLTTGSDFEPLLHLYAMEGDKAFDRLRGMYAFCLVGCDGRTWLVRDPFGIKPLYVLQNQPGLQFASQPRALPRSDRNVGIQQSAELLALHYTVENYVHISRVTRVPAGAIWRVEDGDVLGTGGRLSPPIPPKNTIMPAATGEPEVLAQLDAILEDSVRVHQRSDVPYGLFLSGGIDSSAIAVMMARLNARPVTAFTCGFEAPSARDERAAAERVARALDLDWRETLFTEADFWRIAPLVAGALDDPTSDYATLPTYKLAEAAKATLTVVLTGEGGDELFAGYGRYRRAMRPGWLGGRRAEPQLDAPFLGDGGFEALVDWREETPRPPEGLSVLQQAQWADIATWLPNDLLLKLDRCLMAHGLEGRTPFLDREVAAFAFHLPDRLKVRGRHGKWILRKWLERHCPAADPWAKKKGFTVPVADWIAPRAADLGPRVAAVQGVAGACKAGAAQAVFTDDRQAHNRWPLLFYALWWTIHVGGASPAEAAEAVFGPQ
ncbi:MAG TPA: asparagine synthase (glutamine-hydrolyzing) [Caulobacteraceae bacterium]|jgi:asparagine synthase (glutamine-hydrolysing)|nr:asparagine synthase (glutamine-hydrolyzing) [Caulobacteraceae bacterium]